MDSSFQDWVTAFGGCRKLANALDISEATVVWWWYRRGWPKVETILALIDLSGGALTFEKIVASTGRPETVLEKRRMLDLAAGRGASAARPLAPLRVAAARKAGKGR